MTTSNRSVATPGSYRCRGPARQEAACERPIRSGRLSLPVGGSGAGVTAIGGGYFVNGLEAVLGLPAASKATTVYVYTLLLRVPLYEVVVPLTVVQREPFR